MIRKILAILGGLALWSLLWLLFSQAIAAISLLPGPGEPVTDLVPLIALLLGSITFSLIAGYVAAAISRINGSKVAAALGFVLLLVGIGVQAQYWHLMPLWYHLAFLVCLVPACIAGARLRSTPVET